MTLPPPFEIDQDFIDYNKFRYYEIFVPNDDKVFKSSAKILPTLAKILLAMRGLK
jgi:hypothetical protein